MLTLSPATRIFLALRPIDGRKSFNGLSILVQDTLQQEPTSGFLFVRLATKRAIGSRSFSGMVLAWC